MTVERKDLSLVGTNVPLLHDPEVAAEQNAYIATCSSPAKYACTVACIHNQA